jgi:16S rRNA (cytidine1402-2'-O)-methyltransferase
MKKGALYIVSTPIGNLQDITYRAVNVLNKVDLIAAEDTRHASILLKHYSISTPRVSYYEEIEEERSSELINYLKDGKKIALISNAGTPAISDPGYRLISKAIENDIDIIPIPGATSFVAALVASGMATDRFCFEGFLPKKKGRKTRLREIQEETRTMIFFESPHRTQKTLIDFYEYFGERRCVVAREVTKKYEEFKRGRLSDLIQHFNQVKMRGEFVIIVEGRKKKRMEL